MKNLSILLIMLTLLAGCTQTESVQPTAEITSTHTPIPSPSPTWGISPEAKAYLNEVIEIVRNNALNADQVNWESELDYLYQRELGSSVTADVYDAVLYILLKLNDNHSRFFTPEEMDWFNDLSPESMENPVPVGKIEQGRFAYLKVLSFASGDIEVNLQFGVDLRRLVGELNTQSPCGWVIDLRENTGGNLPPMFVGLEPLIGDGLIGGFQDRDGTLEPITIENGAHAEYGDFNWNQVTLQTVDIQPADPAIAVLVGPHTASAGEMLALAFKGLPHVIYFGHDTAGLATGNSRFDLSDGSMILLTSSVFVDRLGQAYPHGFSPDQPLSSFYESPDSIPPEVLEWLETQESCTSSDP